MSLSAAGKSVDFTTMPTLRRGASQTRIAAGPGQPATLLDSDEPVRQPAAWWSSTTATTTAAYLHDKTGPIAATWIANHSAGTAGTTTWPGWAPAAPGNARRAHQAPRRPAAAGRRRAAGALVRGGRRRRDPGERRACSPCIPGWADLARGMPGYSRDIIGQTPFGWSLDDAMEGLGPRVERAGASSGSWRVRLGELGAVPAGRARAPARPARSRRPVLGRRRRPAARGRRLRAAAGAAAAPTRCCPRSGMSASGCRWSSRAGEDPTAAARVELALATTMPSGRGGADLPVAGPVPVARDDLDRLPGTASAWYHEPAPSRSAAATRPCCCSTTRPG